DRLGTRTPMLIGATGLATGLALPYFVPQIGGLLASASVIGLCYIFYTVSVQHMIGSLAAGAARTRNYSMFSLFVGTTSLLGPTAAGFAIDAMGHRATYLLLAVRPAVPILVLLLAPQLVPRDQPRHA